MTPWRRRPAVQLIKHLTQKVLNVVENDPREILGLSDEIKQM